MTPGSGRITLLLVSTLLVACQSAQYIRTNYDIRNKGVLISSNSPVLQDEITPRREDGRVVFDYPLILKNLAEQSKIRLQLKKASFRIRDLELQTRCTGPNAQSLSFDLGPGKQARINCQVIVDHENEPKLDHSDSKGILTLPFQTAGSTQSLNYEYLLRAEDFE